jgi:hypothetical protein
MFGYGLLEVVSCNLCGSGEIRVLQASQYDSEAGAAELTRTFSSSSEKRLTQRLVVCAECGLQFVSPRLRADVVLEAYGRGTDEQFISQARGRELTFSKASQHGWDVAGCEPNRWLCEWAYEKYGVTVEPGTVFEQQYASNSYDVVTLWDVLEHTADPRSEIREVRRVLADEGLIVVNYPDIGSWIARVMGRSWVFLLDVHLYYFTRATIRKLLEDEGFELVKMGPHFQRLGLGYVLRRAAPYIGTPARMAEAMVRLVGLTDWQVPYWMGQTLVIARKLRRVS